jgi:PIN domain nuclease of toxin-antitoxin system
VTLLLDTHAFLWFVWDDPPLSATAKAAIEDPANRNLLSVASCWGIAIKTGIGKLTLDAPSAVFIPRELVRNGFDLLTISLPHATAVETLPQQGHGGFWGCSAHRQPVSGMTVLVGLLRELE